MEHTFMVLLQEIKKDEGFKDDILVKQSKTMPLMTTNGTGQNKLRKRCSILYFGSTIR